MYNLLIGIRYNAFLCLLINFGFDEDTVVFFRPETTLLYRWVVGSPENIAISACNQSNGWVQHIFWVFLSKKPTLLLTRVLFHDQKLLF